MNKLIFLIAICVSGFLNGSTFAQTSVQINITSQPIWGPVGYDYVEYYYLPEIESYYYVPGHKYIYLENGRWLSRTSLPARHREYNMYNGRKIIVNEPRPYLRHKEYKEKFGTSNEGSNQQLIRDSHDSRYFANKNHPEHAKYKESKKSQGRDKSQGSGKKQEKGNRRK